MAKYSQRDQQMLTEAYSVQLLRESIPTMTLKQVHANIELMTESEAEYVATVSERLIVEFFGGMKALGNVAKNAVTGAGKAFGGAVANKAGQVAQGVKNTAGQVAQGAKQLGGGVAGAAGQVASNVKDIYNTAEQEGKSSSSVKKAIDLSQQLIDLVTQAQQSGILGNIQGEIINMPLGDIVDTLVAVRDSASDFSGQAKSNGIGGGVKQAFKQGMSRP